MKSPLLTAIGALSIALFPQIAPAQLKAGTSEVTTNEFRLNFTAAPGIELTRFALERNATLAVGNWQPVTSPNPVFSETSPGQYRVVVARGPGETSNFFRVLLDGQPITVTFASDPLVIEGPDGPVLQFTFSQPFTGALPVRLTLANGSVFDATLNFINATEANVDINVIPDDDLPQGPRFGTFTVLPDGLGGGTTYLTIQDNDELWDGIFKPENGPELNFCVRRTRQGSADTIQLVNHDNGNFFPIGAGPAATAPVFSSSVMQLVLASANLPAGDSPLGLPTVYELTLDGTPLDASGRSFSGTGTLMTLPGVTLGSLTPDSFEENDSLGAAQDLTAYPSPIDLPDLSIEVANDDDFFRIRIPANTPGFVSIDFDHSGTGDLDLGLLDTSGTPIASSTSTTNQESIAISVAGTTMDYIIRVYGYNSSTNAYRLLVGPSAAPPIDFGALTTSESGSFILIKRSLPPQDSSAGLETPAP